MSHKFYTMQFQICILVLIPLALGLSYQDSSRDSNHDEELVRITNLYDALEKIVEGRGGQKKCQSNMNNYMALFDDSLSYCYNADGKRNGYTNCMDFNQYKNELICELYKETDAYFDITEVKRDNGNSYKSYISSISLSGKYLATLANDCRV